MTDRFERTLEALAEVLVRDLHPAASEVHRAEVRRYVVATAASMPDHFRLGFRALAMLFEYSAFLRHGRRFTRLPREPAAAHVRRWKAMPLSSLRALIALVETFATYGLYCAVRMGSCDEQGRLAA